MAQTELLEINCDLSLHDATTVSDLVRIEQLILSGANVDARNQDQQTPLHIAAWDGLVEATKILIKKGACVDLQVDDGRSAIWMAAGNGHDKVVSELIQAYACVDLQEEDGYTPLLMAAQEGHNKVVQKLVDAQASVDLQELQGISPLHMASRNGHDEVVERLICAQAFVDVQGDDGSTPLYFAAQSGHSKVVEKLIQADVCVDLAEDGGHTPLYVAAQNGHDEVVEKLILARAFVDSCGKEGCSPLYIASDNGQVEIVEKLIRAQASVDLQEENGHSPLFAAAKYGHVEVVNKLLIAGANALLKSLEGISPVAIALRNGHIETADRLLSACQHQDRIKQLSLFMDSLCLNFHGEIFFLAIEKHLLRHEFSELVSSRSTDAFKQVVWDFLDSRISGAVNASPGPLISGRDLHAAMLNSGFCTENAILQSATAAVLEDIIILMGVKSQALVVGSWADGWGSCLTRLNGDIAMDSDIDVTDLSYAAPIHIGRDSSPCRSDDHCKSVKYEDGHIEFAMPVTTPSRPERGSALKPAMDYVTALPCCGYPAIYILQPSHVSQIPQRVLNDLKSMLNSTKCHVVSAAPPGLEGLRMRVSTNLLERKLMHSLSTVQGQLFVILKYLIKIVITGEMGVNGLKTYHAKNLLFYMLDETSAGEWHPDNLIELVKRSLQLLLCHLSEGSEHQCMKHFFLRDAAIYLRKGHLCKQRIADAVTSVINQFPKVLSKYVQNLMPSAIGLIKYHPFLVLPDLWHRPDLDSADCVEYHEIDLALRSVIESLSAEYMFVDPKEELDQLLQEISKIPDSARTARESLRVMAYLKAEDKAGAVEVLTNALQDKLSVSRGVCLNPSASDLSLDRAKLLVWKQLNETDSAWKFCFVTEEKPEFPFLPRLIKEAFPWPAGNYSNVHYMNFDALMKALQLEYMPDKVSARQLFGNVFNGDADPQELVIMLHHCVDEEMAARAIHCNSETIKQNGLTNYVIDFVQSRPTLQQKCFDVVINAMRPGG